MRAKETLKLLQVHRVTLNKYVCEGKIRVTKMANVRYDYNDDDVLASISKKKISHNKK